jgi:ArsR family transcriptional regulator, cadmium/lead-responsive transcriptional repressor
MTGRAEAELLASVFRGFSDPTRLAIMLELARGEKRVADLVQAVGMSQANVSGHLACLKDCGLVEGEPQGRQVFYRISSREVIAVIRAAERVLRRHGHDIDSCPTYGRRNAS